MIKGAHTQQQQQQQFNASPSAPIHTTPQTAQDGTPAADFPDQVSAATRQRRRDELVSLQQRISEGFANSLVGRVIEVLVDGEDEEGGFIGRTQWDAPDGE